MAGWRALVLLVAIAAAAVAAAPPHPSFVVRRRRGAFVVQVQIDNSNSTAARVVFNVTADTTGYVAVGWGASRHYHISSGWCCWWCRGWWRPAGRWGGGGSVVQSPQNAVVAFPLTFVQPLPFQTITLLMSTTRPVVCTSRTCFRAIRASRSATPCSTAKCSMDGYELAR